MPLKQKFSNIFKPNGSVTSHNGPQTAPGPILTPSAIKEDDERTINAAATAASLSDENTAPEAQEIALPQTSKELRKLNRLVASLKEENASLRTTVQQNKSNLIASQYNHLAELTKLNEKLKTASTQLGRLGEEKFQLQAENKALRKKASVTHEIETLKNGRQSRQQVTIQLQYQIQMLQNELEEAKGKDKETRDIIEALDVDRNGLMDELDDMRSGVSFLRSLVGEDLTPRRILTIKMLGNWFPALQGEALPYSQRFLQTHILEHLNINQLDLALTHRADVEAFLASIARRSNEDTSLEDLILLPCHVCKRAKFKARSSTVQNRRLSEFSPHIPQTACCQKSICTACLTKSLNIADDWWYDIESESWLKCPVENCGRTIGIRGVDEIADMFFYYGEQDVEKYSRIYKRALTLRQALTSLNPRPNIEVLSVAASLHKQLILFGFMHELSSDQFDSPTDIENNSCEAFSAGHVLIGSLDRNNLQIPIFTKFFRRSTTAKDCCICAESFHEINFESEEMWMQACEGYHGPWMSEVLLFPTRESLHCDHDMDICKTCLATHLSIQLEQHGRSGCNRLSCPICNRVLSEDEVRYFGSRETVQIFDHYLLINHLSSDPNFRWCLRSGCESGHLVDITEEIEPHIYCDECAFEMCFNHQIPWHEGLSCEQYDSQREHGDPDYHQTQGWIRANSKNCPGPNCGVSIEKDAGCFHMTCQSCRHEFCWQCLAGWDEISPRPGEYVQGAHKRGCWFRRNSLQPTQINGNDLQEAIRQRRD